MISKPAQLIKESQSLFRKWLGFLTFAKLHSRNKELLTAYFFKEFAHFPQYFYHFLQFFEKSLRAEQSSSLKKHLATHYLEILSPLCERFSFFEEKYKLDDLCFNVMLPRKYREIDRIFARYKQTSQKVIRQILAVFKKLLANKHYRTSLKGRYKNLHSIYKKLQKKPHKSALRLNDIFAFRIIVEDPSVDQCFEILNLLHDTFLPIPDYFKDYITIPKINGYQSLHTGLMNVVGALDLPIEVQIRTRAMDDFAERGVAAHWIYGKEKKAKIMSEKEQRLLQYFTSLAETAQNDFMYCFSYLGDIIQLEKGSTVLDFSYQIHTEMGHKTSTALVNGQLQPLDTTLQDGDKVKIVTADTFQVQPAWLSYSHNRATHKKINDYFKRHEKIAIQV